MRIYLKARSFPNFAKIGSLVSTVRPWPYYEYKLFRRSKYTECHADSRSIRTLFFGTSLHWPVLRMMLASLLVPSSISRKQDRMMSP
jgi:hypothetical protein